LSKCQNAGCGVVYELALTSSGWKQIRQFSFSGGETGKGPMAGVTLVGPGYIVGNTYWGGNVHCTAPPEGGCGVAFGLSPNSTSWKETVLHVFGAGNDGIHPVAPGVLDNKGNVYGTTVFGGGENAYGIVFEIAP